MALQYGGGIEAVNFNLDPIFANTSNQDLCIYTETSNQAIHLGTAVGASNPAMIKLAASNIDINTNVVFRNKLITTGSNTAALSNITDAAGIWTTLSNNGVPNTLAVVAASPGGLTSNGSIDLGSNGYFTFSNNGLVAASNVAHSNIISTDFTIEGWVYYYANPADLYWQIPNLIGNMTPGTVGGANYWSFGLGSNRQLAFYTYANSSTPTGVYTRSNAVPLNTWTHIAVTYSNNPKQLSLYVNGVAQSNLTASNLSGSWWTIPGGPAGTTASNAGITNLGPGLGYIVIGRTVNSNAPCYIHDFRMITGTTYIPTPATITAPLLNVPGTRFMLRAAPISANNSNAVITVTPKGYVGIGTSNPQGALSVGSGLFYSPGSVVQVVHRMTNITSIISSGTFTATDIYATVTPKFSNSLLLAHASVQTYTDANVHAFLTFYRDSNQEISPMGVWKLTSPVNPQSNSAFLYCSAASLYAKNSLSYSTLSGSTQPTTFTIYARNGAASSGFVVGSPSNVDGSFGRSEMIIYEIAQ